MAQVKATKRRRRIRRVRKILKRMALRCKGGSAAVEFALIAPVLFVLLMGLIEAGVVFLGQFMLQDAITDAARLIRTGQVATDGMSKTEFRQYVCDKVSALLSCDSNLQIDVESYTDFSASTYTSVLNDDNTLNTDLNNYSTGDVCSVVVVRGFYTWGVATPLLSTFLVNMAGDKHLITAASAFRNEPYNTSVSGC